MVMSKKYVRFLSGLLVLVMMASIGGCSNKAADNATKTGSAQAAAFAAYKEVPVKEDPQLKPYAAAADFSNVINADRFEFSTDTQDLLIKNSFAVEPMQMMEFFPLYEYNRYDFIPNFVTTDSMLHNYHLYFSHLLKSIETKQLAPELKKLNRGMLAASQEQYDALQGTPWENAARRNLAFFTVGSILSDPAIKPEQAVQSEVTQELTLIKKQAGIGISPLMNMGQSQDVLEALKEDYTQYIPRGYYTQSQELTRYFQNMMWYGRLTFRVKSADETRSAVLMTLALNQDKNLQYWNDIYTVSEFMVGKSDDLSYGNYMELLQDIYGNEITYRQLTEDQEKWTAFNDQLSKLKAPQINSIPIFDAEIQPDRNREILGYRFMGQRYTLDADIFQRLIYRDVGENTQGERRMLPRGLDIPAAFGSPVASQILQDLGDYEYENYQRNMSRMQNYTAGLDLSAWTQNLYWNWLFTLKPLTTEKPQGYPSFMLNQAWQKKELNTFLASWTELKHDTILYSKQVMAEAGGGGGEEIDDRGYVEPNPHVYARLAALTAMTREGLTSRNLIGEQDIENLKKLEELALRLKTISEKELQGTLLTDEEFELIRSYGVQLEHFWLEALRDNGVVSPSQLYDNPAALITDVATDPNGSVLQEGTGYVQQIFVVVPVDGSLRIARGGIYSYYEFSGKMSERLTDEKWRQMLTDNQLPEIPAWTKDYYGSGETRIRMPWENV